MRGQLEQFIARVKVSLAVALCDSDTQPSASSFPLLTEPFLSHRILMEIIRVPANWSRLARSPSSHTENPAHPRDSSAALHEQAAVMSTKLLF